ncbi:MAG: phosphate ABC transporter permease PstA [Eubacteriales bacterium]
MRKLYSALKYVCIVALVISLIALAAVVAYVLINGIDKLSFNLIVGEYHPDAPTLLPALAGTLELVAISAIIAVPIGIASAIFLVEYTNNKGKFVRIVQVATETLAGIPSIVYGLFGYLIFVVMFGWGYSMLAGGITLAIMILPTIVRSTQESLLSVQGGLREGAYALGASKVRTIFKIVLPSAAGGIVSAIILAVGRVISESAVLILTIGMVVNKVPETLMSPGTSLALDIYYFASHGYPDEAAATAVVLLVFVILLNLLAGWIGNLIRKSTYGDVK